MDLASRLKSFIIFKAMANSEFADRAGIPRPTLSQLLSGRNKSVNDLFIKRLHSAYPELNVAWLLFGEGDMVNDSNNEISAPQKTANQESLFDDTIDNQRGKSGDEPNLFDIAETPKKSVDAGQPVSPVFVKADVTDSTKKIKNIMVFYTDNSYELFLPAGGPQS